MIPKIKRLLLLLVAFRATLTGLLFVVGNTDYERGVHRLCGVTLGSAWDGGERSYLCEEAFSGFTNLTVSVDVNNFVDSIRLTRNDTLTDSSVRTIRGGIEPTDEELKIIHQVENHFNIRFQLGTGSGLYS